MRTSPPVFKRMVLGVPKELADHTAIYSAAEFAERLKLDLLATLMSDPGLVVLAGNPGIRELRSLEGGWQPIDAEHLHRELKYGADIVRDRLFATLRQRVSAARLEIASNPIEHVAAAAGAEDIVAIIEPPHPAGRIAAPFTVSVRAAFRAAAAFMLIPSRVARSSGPVLAVVTSPEDPSIQVGLTIAKRLGETFRAVNTAGRPLSLLGPEIAPTIGLPSAVPSRIEAKSLAAALVPSKQRLIVLTRGRFDDDLPRMLAQLCGTAVLIVEPDAGDTEAPSEAG